MVEHDAAVAGPSLGSVVSNLSAATPFVGPETIERRDHVQLTYRLGANESLFGPSPMAVEAMRSAAGEIQLYGDPDGYELRTALAAMHLVPIDHVVLGSGIDELLGLFTRAYTDIGDRAVMSRGGYPTMAYHLAGHGIEIVTAPYRENRNDVDALLRAARSTDAKIFYLSNPDNPSGSWLTRSEIMHLIQRLPTSCLLLLDEAYAEFAPPEETVAIAADEPRIVRLRTFSKAYGLAGLRVGYAIGNPRLIRPIDRIRNHFGVGRIALAGALAALRDQDHVASVIRGVAEGRVFYREIAEAAGCRTLPSATNFVAIDVGSRGRAGAMLTELQNKHGVFVRMPGLAPFDRYIRVTVGRRFEQAAFARAFNAAWAETQDS